MINVLTITKKQWTIFCGLFLFILTLAIVLVWLYSPVLPKKIIMAGGPAGGSFNQFASDFKSALKAKSGIEVEIRPTTGAVENARLINSTKSEFDLALSYSGAVHTNEYPNISVLASVYYAPLWIWYRPESFKDELELVSQLQGKRLAIGPVGSGTEHVVKDILAVSMIEKNQLTLVNGSFEEGKNLLLAGKVDAAAFEVGIESPIISELGREKGIKLMNFKEADAYARLMHSLSKISVPQGNISIPNHVPSKEIQLIGEKAMLISRPDITPGLVNEIMGVLYEPKFRNYSKLQNMDEFPNNQGLTISQNEEAKDYMKEGPSFLYRHLPVWLAAWVEGILKIIIPLSVLIIPLQSVIPKAFALWLQITLARAYMEMKNLELEAMNAEAKNLSKDDYAQLLKKIEEFEVWVNSLKVPAFETEKYFNLKSHIDLIRNRVRTQYLSKD